ncbi:MAG: 3-ketoacyl-ACP reductase [Bacteroidota bacterium]
MSQKTAFITGGTRGIGLGIAEELASRGYDLALNGVRSAEQVQNITERFAKQGTKAHYLQGDIGSSADRERMLSELKANFSRLDLLVNNAGVAPRERNDILEATESSYDWVMNINLKGPYFLTQAIANWMIGEGRGDNDFRPTIINISSVSASLASVNRGEYCLSKAGIGMATQLWATRLAEYGISVFEVRPGIIETDMTSGVKAKYDQLFAEGLSLQSRWGTPSDVGKAVAALASGDFPYSTGQVVMVDGGMTIGRL